MDSSSAGLLGEDISTVVTVLPGETLKFPFALGFCPSTSLTKSASSRSLVLIAPKCSFVEAQPIKNADNAIDVIM